MVTVMNLKLKQNLTKSYNEIDLCNSHFSRESINRFPLRLGIVETTDCLFKHGYDEEIFC